MSPQTPLSSLHAPLTPLPLEFLDYVLPLRRSSVPNVTPKAAPGLKGERERRTSESKHERERTKRPVPQDTRPFPGSWEAKAKASSCLPFCHSQRKPARPLSLSTGGVPRLPVPHSQETLAVIIVL